MPGRDRRLAVLIRSGHIVAGQASPCMIHNSCKATPLSVRLREVQSKPIAAHVGGSFRPTCAEDPSPPPRRQLWSPMPSARRPAARPTRGVPVLSLGFTPCSTVAGYPAQVGRNAAQVRRTGAQRRRERVPKCRRSRCLGRVGKRNAGSLRMAESSRTGSAHELTSSGTRSRCRVPERWHRW